ncbi:MAG: GH25 family lysozyme [Clostridiales bacterium]|uniref:GH25 family lysozyme n=1 Tax=Evtepia sp. TaxID=2773933 RepID=UPI0029878FE8|nr:GH25 family lysozyme [Evtepia sp.]MDD7288868.1 GH25 family lysozyme [Clostridiales bacterium]MDY4431344.1 GH25 family lysozyme [Evtepia sp.]
MKQKILSLLLLCCLSFSLAVPASAASSLPFSDVPSNIWYYTYVKDLYDSKVINGTTATTFSPQGTVTFGQALKLILLAAGYEEQAPTTTHWASGYYRLASQKGFLPSNLNLTLDQPITRLQIASIAVRTLGLTRTSSKSPFSDTTDQSALILYDHGVFTGVETETGLLFKPNDNITRAEVSAVIWRIDQLEEENTPTTPAPPAEETGDYFYFGGKKVYVVEELPKSTYDNSLFQVNENGFLTYDSDEYTCKIGIDVSRYQENIDWAAVKGAGVQFAMLRLGYRGYGSGALVMDPYFQQNIQGAQANGIEVGVYFFSQAITPEEGAEEARFCLNALKGYHITYPIVFDWESYDSSLEPRTDGLDDKILTQCAVAFCEEVEAAGYQSMVYSNLTYFYLHFDLNQLVDYPLWLAQYNSRPSFYYHFDIWQYSGTGKVPGIDGNVDLNIHFIPKK